MYMKRFFNSSQIRRSSQVRCSSQIRRCLAGLAALLLGAWPAGCGAAGRGVDPGGSAAAGKATGSPVEAGSGTSGAADDAGLETIDIVLDWYPNAIHCFIYTAIEAGYYTEEGLKVNVLYPASPNDGITMPAAGRADVGLFYPHDILFAKANEQVPLKVIGSLCQEPLNVVVSLKEKNITGPDDLNGKILGYPGNIIAESMAKSMITRSGEPVRDLTLQDIGFDLLTSMSTGQVDATIGCMINHEVPVMEEQGLEVNYFYPTDFGVPDYYEMVFVTGEQRLAERRDALTRFLRASRRGFDQVKADPEAAVDHLLRHQAAAEFPLTKSVEMKSIRQLIPAMEHADAPFLSQSPAVWQTCADWMAAQNLLEHPVDPKDLLVDLLPPA